MKASDLWCIQHADINIVVCSAYIWTINVVNGDIRLMLVVLVMAKDKSDIKHVLTMIYLFRDEDNVSSTDRNNSHTPQPLCGSRWVEFRWHPEAMCPADEFVATGFILFYTLKQNVEKLLTAPSTNAGLSLLLYVFCCNLNCIFRTKTLCCLWKIYSLPGLFKWFVLHFQYFKGVCILLSIFIIF